MNSKRSKRRAAAGLLAVAVAVTAAGCGPRPPAGEGLTSPAVPAAAPPAVFVVDADQDGAVVLDGGGGYAGVRRDGSVAWREPAGRGAAGLVSCLARCPDAVLSTSLDGMNDGDVADPAPRVVVGGRWASLDRLGGHKRRVLSAEAPDRLVVATGDPGDWRLEFRDGSTGPRVPVGGFASSWRSSADGRHGLAVTETRGGNEARWFSRDRGGWHQVGETLRVQGITSCVAPDGGRALLLGQRPEVVDRGDDEPLGVTDLASAGDCAWSLQGGIVAELAHTTSGPRSRLRAFDATGTVRWRLDLAGEAALTADPTSGRVAYLAGQILHELDPVKGVELRALPGIRSARYDPDGGLVTVGGDGAVRWLQ